jgi:glycosyltransferase involved in cell wall biosynthesis
LRIARGIQNKVLEAMAMSRPVVATPQAREGIAAVDGRDLFLASDAATLADRVSLLLESGSLNEVAGAARRFVLAHHNWSANMRGLDDLIARLVDRESTVGPAVEPLQPERQTFSPSPISGVSQDRG